MTKRRLSKRRRAPKVPKKTVPWIASTDEDIQENRTLAREPESIADWHDDATSDVIPEEDLDSGALQATYPGLIREFLAGGIALTRKQLLLMLFLAYILIVGWLFLQDNGAGRLDTQAGLSWYLVKVRYVSLFFLALALIVLLTASIRAILLRVRP